MRDIGDDIFLVPHRGQFILHAPLRGITSALSADAALEVRAFFSGEACTSISENLLSLLRSLADRRPEYPHPPHGRFSPRRVGIILTNGCNMRCIYCAVEAGDESAVIMSERICLTALQYQADIVRREQLDRFELCYFGGEPFYAWELLQYCDYNARRLAAGLGVPYCASCDTNGFMPIEQARWAAAHLNHAVVSMDGPADIHDRLRPSVGGSRSHAVVARTLRLFKEEGLPFGIRCTVDSRSVNELPASVGYFCQEFAPDLINVEPVLCKGRCRGSAVRPPNPEDFIRAVVAAGRVARAYGTDIRVGSAQVERVVHSYCDIASDQFVVAPDGMVTGCYSANHFGSPLASRFAIGDIEPSSGVVYIDVARVELMRACTVRACSRCQSCFCQWHCAGGCCAHRWETSDGDADGFCEITQQLSLWRLLLRLRLFSEADRIGEEEVGYAYAGA